MFKHKFPLIVFGILAFGLLFASSLAAADATQVRVKVDKANVRESPSLTAPVVASVDKGEVFKVFEKADEWYMIQLPNNKTGYIHQFVVDEIAGGEAGKAAEPAAAEDLGKVRVKVEKANVRQAAQMEAPVVGGASRGDVFDILEKAGEWYLIALPDGTKGYVHKFVVDEVGEGAAAGEEIAPTPEETQPVKRPAARVAPKPRVQTAKGDTFSMFLARVGYFLSSDSQAKDIYKDGMVFGGEIRFGGKSLGGWIEGNYRSATGKLSFTQEETKMTVMAAEAGVLYRFAMDNLNPYLGGGAGYYMFNEKSDALGEAKKSSVGFCVLGGVTYFLGSSLAIDARIKWSTCSMTPADYDINIGGITVGAGIGIRF